MFIPSAWTGLCSFSGIPLSNTPPPRLIISENCLCKCFESPTTWLPTHFILFCRFLTAVGVSFYLHCGQAPAEETVNLNDICYIVTTSGTTKPEPKLVYVKRSSIMPNIKDFM